MEYKGYHINKYNNEDGFVIQYEDGGIFFDNVSNLEQCYNIIDTYYYDSNSILRRRDGQETDNSHICPWID